MQEVYSAEKECDSVCKRDSFNIFLSTPTNPEGKQDCKMFCKSVSVFKNNTGIQALLCSRHLVGFHKRVKRGGDENHGNPRAPKLHPPRVSHCHGGHTITDGYSEAKVLHFIPEAASLIENAKN